MDFTSPERAAQEPSSTPAPPRRAVRILIADDDEMLVRFLERLLVSEGYEVQVAPHGEQALQLLDQGYHLLILDLNLPELDGLHVLTEVRKRSAHLPVLVLTARDRAEGMLPALNGGADDCLLKPFSYLELLARVRALLRRTVAEDSNVSQCGDLTLSREPAQVRRGEKRIELTQREFALLEFLMRTPEVPVARKLLLKEVWGASHEPSTNVVDVYMKYVRDKVDLPGLPQRVRTVRGVGYMVSAQ